MKHPWIRIQDIANMVGLLLGAISIFIVGQQINNALVKFMGLASLVIFIILLIILLYLCFKDSKTLYSHGKLRFKR